MLRDKMPRIYSNSGLMLELFQVEDTEIESFQSEIDNTANQFFIDTADTLLDAWEEEVGIPKSTLPNDQRRSAIKSKLRGYGTVTVNHIKNVCDAYTNGDVAVIEKNNNYEFEIKFQSIYGIPPNMDDLKNIIEQIKPAHLGVTYTFKYVVYDELKMQYPTYDALAASGLTYNEILGGGN